MISITTYHNKLFIRDLTHFNSLLNCILCAAGHIAIAILAWRSEIYTISYPLTLLLQWAAKYHKQHYHSFDAQHLFAPYGTGRSLLMRFASIDFFDISTALIVPHLTLIAIHRPQCLVTALCATAANSMLISYASLIIKRRGTARWANGLWVAVAMITTKAAEHFYPNAQVVEQQLMTCWSQLTAAAIALLGGSLLMLHRLGTTLLHSTPFYTAASMKRNRPHKKK